jgi:hypothetical protein
VVEFVARISMTQVGIESRNEILCRADKVVDVISSAYSKFLDWPNEHLNSLSSTKIFTKDYGNIYEKL